MKKTVLSASLILLVSAGLSAFETTRNLSLPVEGLKNAEIRAGAGSLTVVGREGLTAIEVKAEIVARHVREEDMEEFLKDRVELVLEKRGDSAVLVSRVRERLRLFSFDGGAVINLTVSVPKTLPLDIDDGSGSLVAQDLSALRIDDGSGSIKVERIAGDLTIDDGSGDIQVYDVAGSVSVDDGSGGIVIDDVGKDVRLISTGSGGVDVSNVKGRVIESR